MQIAIDGPASSGKSTIAKIIAQKLGFIYCDTGAMYRVATLLAIQNHIDFGDELAIDQLLNESDLKFIPNDGQQRVLLNDQDVTDRIRQPDVTNNVSQVSALPLVRKTLVATQQKIADKGQIVMDGRDIGTNVLPNADVKIFMTASVEQRAKRRYDENLTKGITTPLAELQAELEARDYKDTHRALSPLKKADDAIEIDTTNLNIDEVVEKILEIIKKKS